MNPYDINSEHPGHQAWEAVCNTHANLFLTGSAGTGKTTFLRRLRESNCKRMVVLAPTGVAAINAGGVTLHSFFQLPFSTYHYGLPADWAFRLRKEKLKLIRSLDLIIIDEISMVRADLLDAVDATLRAVRRSMEPFGGVQLLMIGDLHQLTPVVTESEVDDIARHYASPYFFSSRALQMAGYYYIALNKIYRQTDSKFISILNGIRDNQITPDMLGQLNQRYKTDLGKGYDDYIRLTTHNWQADEINDRMFRKLPSRKEKCYTYKVHDNFPESSFPAEKELKLKVGARVMFIKNGRDERNTYYFNGKTGIVEQIGDETVTVRCEGDEVIEVGYETWENKKFVLNEQTKQIDEKTDGTFMQIPLRLAWAVTIHKSQGLTFDKIIVDAQNAFAHGQVYVALSRCRTLEGLILASPIGPQSIIFDRCVVFYLNEAHNFELTDEVIREAKSTYTMRVINEMFNFRMLLAPAYRILFALKEFCARLYPTEIAKIDELMTRSQEEIVAIGDKFIEICRAAGSTLTENDELMKRVQKGSSYFLGKLAELPTAVLSLSDLEIDRKDVAQTISDERAQLSEELRVATDALTAVEKKGFSAEIYVGARTESMMEDGKKSSKKATKSEKPKKELVLPSTGLSNKLRAWRKARAEELGLPAYCILQQVALVEICNNAPRDLKALGKITGVGKKTLEKYGKEILAIVNG